MSNSMQEDLDRILGKPETPSQPEISAAGRSLSGFEAPLVSEIKSEAAPTEPSLSGTDAAPLANGKASLAEHLQAAKESAMAKEKEFEESLRNIQMQDPREYEKIKRYTVLAAIMVLLLGSIIVYSQYKNKSAKETASVNMADQSAKTKATETQDKNDNMRVKNLTAVAQIAVVYHLEQGIAFPITDKFIKLNESNTVSSFFRSALVKYNKAEETLLDPRNPDFYYAYRSLDGRSIELSARLENESGELCKKNNSNSAASPCIYKTIITEAEMSQMSESLDRYK